MTSPDSSTMYTGAPEKKSWWASLPAMPKLPSLFGTGSTATPSAPSAAISTEPAQTAGHRRGRRGGMPPKNSSFKRPITSKSQLNSQREMIKLAVKNSMKKSAKGGRKSHKTKKHSRR